ncbi:unnamed protein product, partial [Hapterophycus canaliculatus]
QKSSGTVHASDGIPLGLLTFFFQNIDGRWMPLLRADGQKLSTKSASRFSAVCTVDGSIHWSHTVKGRERKLASPICRVLAANVIIGCLSSAVGQGEPVHDNQLLNDGDLTA